MAFEIIKLTYLLTYNVAILQHFHDIITCTVYLTALHLPKSYSFDKTVEITSQVTLTINLSILKSIETDAWKTNTVQSMKSIQSRSWFDHANRQ